MTYTRRHAYYYRALVAHNKFPKKRKHFPYNFCHGFSVILRHEEFIFFDLNPSFVRMTRLSYPKNNIKILYLAHSNRCPVTLYTLYAK